GVRGGCARWRAGGWGGPRGREAVLALLLAQLREHAIDTPSDEVERALDALLRRRHRGQILVAALGGRLVGFAALSFGLPLEHGAPGAWLEGLFVGPPARGCGLGTTPLPAAPRAGAGGGAAPGGPAGGAARRR